MAEDFGMTGHHDHDDVLDAKEEVAFKRSFNKLSRSAGGDALRKIAELSKGVALSVAETAALERRCGKIDRQLAEVTEIVARIEANREAVERANEGFEKIRAAVNTPRTFRPDDLMKLADRGDLMRFLN
jgi:hypothetical protein